MKADAIVHPGAVVVHFQGASLAHRTVMGPVWFDAKALLAISDSILNTSLLDLAAKLICQGGEQGLPFLLGLSSTQFLHLVGTEMPRRRSEAWRGEDHHGVGPGEEGGHAVENNSTDHLLCRGGGHSVENHPNKVCVV